MICTDKVIGDILAGWRYDISGLAPEMRGDYEQHLAECAHCHSRQVLHRTEGGFRNVFLVLACLAVAVLASALFFPSRQRMQAAQAAAL